MVKFRYLEAIVTNQNWMHQEIKKLEVSEEKVLGIIFGSYEGCE
jgi:hypothetical protein